MLLNISAFILAMMMGIIPFGVGAMMYKSHNDNKWFVMHRGKIMIALLVGIFVTIVTTSICMYEITQIQNRLRAEILEIQQTKY